MKSDAYPVKLFLLIASVLIVVISGTVTTAAEEMILMDQTPESFMSYGYGGTDTGIQSSENAGDLVSGGFTTTPVSDPSGSNTSGSDSNSSDKNDNPAAIPDSVTGQKFEGTGTAVDYAEDASKVFYTIETADDKVFYLIIDKEKTSNNTYFLREINEDEMSVKEMAVPTPTPVTAEPAPTKSSGVSAPLIGLVTLGGLGGAYYLIRRKSKENEEEYEDNILPDPDDGSDGEAGYESDNDTSSDDYEDDDMNLMLYSILDPKKDHLETALADDQIVMHNYGPYGPRPDYASIFGRRA